ncbi:GNAT superfamily N-acetyltransferase [Nocardioides thalensis]|uniref:GNAT superfamily N-acetyltransferase n=1 Tax=Nocardioides thalensis TaxID=1914755 RepID=A0A853BZ45_9ACTN|nr:GNAT family N-acetyltransferase [Nocardioides thalensis]NYI99751.1 GNAT superfamily N-acetyltransferase [Nocardioides thalensis]
MEIRAADASPYDHLVDLELARIPREPRAAAEWIFVNAAAMPYFHLRTAHRDGGLVGFARISRGPSAPTDTAFIHVVVAREAAHSGVGSALYDALLTLLPEGVTRLVSWIDDADEESLAIARAHGFEPFQHGIESELPLVDLPEPLAIDGVTYEDVSSLEFADEDAVDAMVVDSQTNPEAVESGIISRLEHFRLFAKGDGSDIAVLARVDGAPAAVIIGDINPDDRALHIHYTGVGQSFRGRNLAFALKQYAHRLAADRGAVISSTMNEERNAGIRHVNAALGYRVKGGIYRVRKQLT